MLSKIYCKQENILKKCKGKRQKLLVQINNFQFNKGRANKIIALRRMLESNMLECREYIHCEKDNKKHSKFLKNQINKLKTRKIEIKIEVKNIDFFHLAIDD